MAPFFKTVSIAFKWHPGLSRAQAQRSIQELHHAAEQAGISPILEISSRSATDLGMSLSAFHLTLLASGGQEMTVEVAYQGSKVFEHGSPYTDLYGVSSKAAKQDPRVRESGNITGFDFLGIPFPTTPRTFFYDFLYVQALLHHPEKAAALMQYGGFTDIAFNPEKSEACQARCAAMWVGMQQAGISQKDLRDPQALLQLLT